MTTWKVTHRETGAVVHAYTADTPADWPDYPFAQYNHIAEVPPAPDPDHARRLTKLEYMNRFHDAELAAIYSAAKVSVAVEVWLAKFNAATPDADGTSVDLDDPRTIAGVRALEDAGLLGTGRAAEILA